VITGYMYKDASIGMEFHEGWVGVFEQVDETFTIVDNRIDGVTIEADVSRVHAIARMLDVYNNHGVDDLQPDINELINLLTDELGMNLVEYVERHEWLEARVELLEQLRSEASGSKAEEIVLDLANALLPHQQVVGADNLEAIRLRAKQWAEAHGREVA